VKSSTNGFEAPAIYNMIDLPIAPLHYYGDPAQYDYETTSSASRTATSAS
jgi:peptide/nickel transport system substrate-binding protein